MYLNRNKTNDFASNIQFLETGLNSYKEKEELAPARKLIQKRFKKYLDSEIKNNN